MSGLAVGRRQQLDRARTTVHKRSRFLEYWNRFVRLALGDEYESGDPVGECFIGVDGQHAVQFSNGLVIPTGKKQNPTDLRAGSANRIKFASTARPCEPLLDTSPAHKPAGEPKLRSRVTRLQVERHPIFGFRFAPRPLTLIYLCQQDMCFGELRIQFQRLSRVEQYLWTQFTG